MVRRPRSDAPGRLHHIFNRASRRRVLFADQQDFRYFLMLIACSVRRGELIVHSYCLMNTHFHMLAASPDGRISFALMRIQNAYARYYNRRRRHDGALFRGRFGSRPVRSLLYYVTLLRYIAANPVQAALSSEPLSYAYSSARHFVSATHPKWFERPAVARVLGWDDDPSSLATRYARLLAPALSRHEIEVIERRMNRPRQAEDALDQLFRAPPRFLASWMARKIRAEGGPSPWEPLASASAVITVIDEMRAREGSWPVRIERNHYDGWALLAAGLLQTVACVTADVASRRLGVHSTTALRRARIHREQLTQCEEYEQRAGVAAHRALARTYPAHDDVPEAGGRVPFI